LSWQTLVFGIEPPRPLAFRARRFFQSIALGIHHLENFSSPPPFLKAPSTNTVNLYEGYSIDLIPLHIKEDYK
jgi:hypothetical protein